MRCRFDCSRLVDGNMPCFGTENTLIAFEKVRESLGIRLSAADKEIYIGILVSDRLFNLFLCFFAVGIKAVCYLMVFI